MSRASNLKLQERDLNRLSTTSTKIVRFLAGGVTTLIAWKILEQFFSDLNLTPEGSWAFVQITVVFYFFSWFMAALRGIEIQSLLLNTTGESTTLPFAAYFALLVGFPVGLSAMLLVLYPKYFGYWVALIWNGQLTEFLVLVLAVFWIWDMFWQWSVRKTMLSRIEQSKNNLEGTTKMYLEKEQLKYLEKFLFGSWRIYRKIFGATVIVVLLLSVFWLGEFIEVSTLPVKISATSFIAISTFLFVLISEGWTWIMRLRLITGIGAVESIGQQYTLSKKSGVEIQT